MMYRTNGHGPKDWELELYERSIATYKVNKNLGNKLGQLTSRVHRNIYDADGGDLGPIFDLNSVCTRMAFRALVRS